jgi:hypothetical protein
MEGDGSCQYTFDPQEMINRNLKKAVRGKPIKNLISFIKFEGQGIGRIDIYGDIANSVMTATDVDVHFSVRGSQSPVKVGLFSVNCVNGEYKYENRFNEIVAWIDTLSFARTENEPRLGIKLASYGNENAHDFSGRAKAFLANIFINPVEIDKAGNDAMLDFGLALYEKKPQFTFPKAMHLKE